MKAVTLDNEKIKISKKDIRSFLNLKNERGISYYSHLSENTLAYAVSISELYFGWDGSETKSEMVEEIYNNVVGLIDFFNHRYDYKSN